MFVIGALEIYSWWWWWWWCDDDVDSGFSVRA